MSHLFWHYVPLLFMLILQEFCLELEFCLQSASLVKFVSFTFHSEFFTFNTQDEILTVNFLVFSPLYCSSVVLISVLTVMQSIIVLS